MRGGAPRPHRAEPEAIRPVEDAWLRAELQDLLPGGRPLRVVRRRTFKRRTDWRGERLFEHVVVRRSGEEPIELCLKYARPAPCGRPDGAGAEREARAYEFLNLHPVVGAPRFHGRLPVPTAESCVLVLDYVTGRRLKRITSEATWREAAGWLGRLHGELAAVLDGPGAPPRLPERDRAHYAGWFRRAASVASRRCPGVRPRLEALVEAHGPVSDLLASATPTLVHGELYCTNVMLRPTTGAFCPFDWETAAVGCGTLDLACLGRQGLGIARGDLLAAYVDGWTRATGRAPNLEVLRAEHAAARVHEEAYLLWTACCHRGASDAKVERYVNQLEGLVSKARSTASRCRALQP